MSSKLITKPFVKGKLIVIDRDSSGKKTGQHEAVPGELITMSKENFDALAHCFEGEGKPLNQDEMVVKALNCIDFLESMDADTKDLVQEAMEARNADSDLEGEAGKGPADSNAKGNDSNANKATPKAK